jgi:hypothetical protein
VRAHYTTPMFLLAVAALAHVGGCVDVTPFPAPPAESTCELPLDEGGCDESDAESGAMTSDDGGGE